FLAPLILFVPAYIAIGVSAPKHRTDLLGGFARRLLLSSLVLAGIAVGSIFLPGEQLSLTVFRGGITSLAVLLGASQAILVIRQKRGLVPKS
ncbi:MAG: hypothetical protein JWN69_2429, partial [Alphaproteobacteria bacterium]|nr:hypothetical protein [Alphaproteobacteria bacterium]